jgi:hypothetical protein
MKPWKVLSTCFYSGSLLLLIFSLFSLICYFKAALTIDLIEFSLVIAKPLELKGGLFE